jgi:hypothetical protein
MASIVGEESPRDRYRRSGGARSACRAALTIERGRGTCLSGTRTYGALRPGGASQIFILLNKL